MNSLRSVAGKLLTLTALCAAALAAAAQPYPARPIRLVVPYPPGGNVDITARVIGPLLGEQLGQTIVVDNRSGAGGNLGANLVARAAPDGYTLLMGSSGPLAINPIVIRDTPYDSLKDFAPVSRVHVVPLVVLAGQKAGIGSVKELVALARANPGKVTVASAGTGTTNHLGIELFSMMAGVKVLHVPYKGSGPALAELLGGQVQFMFDQLTSSIGYIRDGRLKALAVGGSRRSEMLPGVPTLEESGLKGYEASTFIGVLAPGGTPQPVIEKLNAAMRKVMENPGVTERFRALGADPGSSSPAEFARIIRDELAKWRAVVQRAGLKFD
ncbi:MAG TPA: tripartite tricarboxylate transporter substrate binding protein [Burkholderiales bacterium]|nr:tripartite tricarboxylate transporter substrate binding protein [Burkholderiales bacterium]